jgi:hypothetical protein
LHCRSADTRDAARRDARRFPINRLERLGEFEQCANPERCADIVDAVA